MLARPGSAFNGGGARGVGRPGSAAPGWPGGAGQTMSRPQSAAFPSAAISKSGRPGTAGASGSQRMYRPGSAGSIGPKKAVSTDAGGTRAMVDWKAAGDLAQRGQRYDARSLRRQAASTGQLPKAVEAEYLPATDFTCPLARGPVGEPLRTEVRPTSASWHKKKVKQIYKVLDPTRDGAVRLEQLRDSFEVLSVPINDETFEQYAQDFLPSGSRQADATVEESDFKNFHKKVWANQPGFVRWNAGDPTNNSQAAFGEESVMRRVGSAPTIVSTGELRNNEFMLRKTFMRHADGRSALLHSDKIPAVLLDLGLPDHLSNNLDTTDLDKCSPEMSDEISFHQTVSIVNKCIATHEAGREVPLTNAAVTKVSMRLEAALRYSVVLGEEDETSDEESALKTAAVAALEAALLFGDDDEPDDDLKFAAMNALEAALLGDVTPPASYQGDDMPDEFILKAQAALEAALGGGDDEDMLSRARGNAKRSLETLLLGKTDPEDAAEGLKYAAMEALEAALLGGDGVVDEELVSQAQEALEAVLLGGDDGGMDEEQELSFKAQEAMEAALLGPEDA